MKLERITFDPNVMAGRPCLRGTRVPVSVVLKLLAGGMTRAQILADYPYLESADIDQSIEYAALLADDRVLEVAH